MLQGGEPRELIREYYRLRRRARDLVDAVGGDGDDAFSLDLTGERDAFLAWYAEQHDDVADAEDAGTIISEWGPHHHPGERSLYGCSPHRIQMAAHLIRNGEVPGPVAGEPNSYPGLWRMLRSGCSCWTGPGARVGVSCRSRCYPGCFRAGHWAAGRRRSPDGRVLGPAGAPVRAAAQAEDRRRLCPGRGRSGSPAAGNIG
jgi:hypothetical protein